jgi:ABC-type amino acid transport substrate-binding protein
MSPGTGTDVIGQSLTVTWRTVARDGAPAKTDSDLAYTVEYRCVDKTHSVRTFVPYYAFEPPEGEFTWRVRAERRYLEKAGWTAVSDWSPWQRNAFYRSTLERVRRTRILRLAVSKDYLKPFIYSDETSNDLDGIDIRVSRGIGEILAKSLGLPAIQIEYKPNSWLEGNASDLKLGIADLAIGDTSIEKSREEAYHIRFSIPYWYAGMAIVTLKDYPSTNLTIARLTAWRGTTHEQVARLLTTSYEPSSNIPEMFSKLESRTVEGFIDGTEIAWHTVSRAARGRIAIKTLEVHEIPDDFKKAHPYPVPSGLYVNERETELIEQVNQALISREGVQLLRRVTEAYRNANGELPPPPSLPSPRKQTR